MVQGPASTGRPAPPSSLWSDPRVFVATFLDVPSFTRPRHGHEAAAAHAQWLATALFTPPPGEPSSCDAAAEPESPRSAEPPAGRPHTGAAPVDNRAPRVYSRDALLALRPPASSPPPEEIVRVAYLLSSASESFDESLLLQLPQATLAAAAATDSSGPLVGPVPPGVRTDAQDVLRGRLERVRGVALELLYLLRAAKGEVALFRLRFFVELAQSLVVPVLPASGEKLRCFEKLLNAHLGRGPHYSVRLLRAPQKQLLWWCNQLVPPEHTGEPGGVDGGADAAE